MPRSPQETPASLRMSVMRESRPGAKLRGCTELLRRGDRRSGCSQRLGLGPWPLGPYEDCAKEGRAARQEGRGRNHEAVR